MKKSEHSRRGLYILAMLFSTALLTGCPDPRKPGFQGYFEGEYVRIAPQTAGRLEALHVRRGQKVETGAALFDLDPQPEEKALAEVQNALSRAKCLLADLKKGLRPSEIEAIEARISQTRSTHELAAAEFKRREKLFAGRIIPSEELDRARTEMTRAEAALADVSAQLETARLGARPDAIEAAEHEVEAARDRVAQAEWRVAQKSLVSPVSGIVADTYYLPGEFIPAAYPVISILPPSKLFIRFFVPETRVHEFAPGRRVFYTFDGDGTDSRETPKSGRSATVTFVATGPEFTPPVIYSRETRSKLVYMVEAVPDDPTTPEPSEADDTSPVGRAAKPPPRPPGGEPPAIPGPGLPVEVFMETPE